MCAQSAFDSETGSSSFGSDRWSELNVLAIAGLIYRVCTIFFSLFGLLAHSVSFIVDEAVRGCANVSFVTWLNLPLVFGLALGNFASPVDRASLENQSERVQAMQQ